MAAERGIFIDQSQSLNIHMKNATVKKITSYIIYACKLGLKTGIYYMRTRSAVEAQQFTIDPSLAADTETGGAAPASAVAGSSTPPRGQSIAFAAHGALPIGIDHATRLTIPGSNLMSPPRRESVTMPVAPPGSLRSSLSPKQPTEEERRRFVHSLAAQVFSVDGPCGDGGCSL
jgi:ribonucleotide reductase alpha subunit